MRFRASISRENIFHLYNIVSQLEKVGKVAAIYATSSSVKIAVVAENMEAPRCYAEIYVNAMFQDYKINSLSGDCILFEIGLENFARALGSARRSHMCTLKLVKRGQQPCICCNIKELDGGSMEVFHDIQIRLLRVEEIHSFAPPEVPPPMVALEIPQLKDSYKNSSSSSSSSILSSGRADNLVSRSTSHSDSSKSRLCNIIDKMTKFTKLISLTAYKSGNLEIISNHTACTITTVCSDMIPIMIDELGDNVLEKSNASSSNGNSNSHASSTVTVDGKKLGLALNVGALPTEGVFLYMTDRSALVVHVALQSKSQAFVDGEREMGSLTYYVPVIMSDDD
jgi:hypothetical protein